jgi:toxin ParE1/3/4
MTNRVQQTASALNDIETIWNYIAGDNLKAADRVSDRVAAVLSMLADNPMAGRPRHNLTKGLRSFPCSPYVIFYVPTPDGIRVIRVLHGAQDIEKSAFQ